MLFHSHIHHVSRSLLLRQRSLESRGVRILVMRVGMGEGRVLSFLSSSNGFSNDRGPKDHKFWASSLKSESYIIKVYDNGSSLVRTRCSQRIVIKVMEEVPQEGGISQYHCLGHDGVDTITPFGQKEGLDA